MGEVETFGPTQPPSQPPTARIGGAGSERAPGAIGGAAVGPGGGSFAKLVDGAALGEVETFGPTQSPTTRIGGKGSAAGAIGGAEAGSGAGVSPQRQHLVDGAAMGEVETFGPFQPHPQPPTARIGGKGSATGSGSALPGPLEGLRPGQRPCRAL